MLDTGNKFSLVECMQEVPDPRTPYSQKHKLIDIIMIAVTAVLCGIDTWNEIEGWAHSKREWLGSFLELSGGKGTRKGRQEIREQYVENSIVWLKECHPEWKGLDGIGACRSTVTEKGETTTAISYSIYSQLGMGTKRQKGSLGNQEPPALGTGYRIL